MYDFVKVLQSFGRFIRFRNLGFIIILFIILFLIGGVQLIIEVFVGENIDIDVVKKVKKLLIKYSGEFMREVMGFELKIWLNVVGNRFGFFDLEE